MSLKMKYTSCENVPSTTSLKIGFFLYFKNVVAGSLLSLPSNFTIKFILRSIWMRPLHSVTEENQPFQHHLDVLLVPWAFWLSGLRNQFHCILKAALILYLRCIYSSIMDLDISWTVCKSCRANMKTVEGVKSNGSPQFLVWGLRLHCWTMSCIEASATCSIKMPDIWCDTNPRHPGL